MSVNKYKDSYVVSNKGFSVSYSVNSFGKYAKTLAEMAERDRFKYRNYYEFYDDVVIMIIFSKKYGYHKIPFNRRHFDEVKRYRWHINKQDKTFYCNGKLHGGRTQYQLHRVITGYKGKLQIDHIDRNGLNNLDSNLRIVSASTNQRNTDCKAKHKIWTNVSVQYPKKGGSYFLIRWTNLKGIGKTKNILFNEENYDEMKHKAIRKSITKRALNGYTLNEKDKEYIKKHKMKIITKF